MRYISTDCGVNMFMYMYDIYAYCMCMYNNKTNTKANVCVNEYTVWNAAGKKAQQIESNQLQIQLYRVYIYKEYI